MLHVYFTTLQHGLCGYKKFHIIHVLLTSDPVLAVFLLHHLGHLQLLFSKVHSSCPLSLLSEPIQLQVFKALFPAIGPCKIQINLLIHPAVSIFLERPAEEAGEEEGPE